MPITASLRELGIPDVFQLMELGRKTGVLRVSATASGDEGMVVFENGRVIHASIRGRPSTAEERLRAAGRISELDLEYASRMAARDASGATVLDILIEAGTISPRLVEQETRANVESVVFEMMSWRDGFASFEARAIGPLVGDERVELRAESLLVEGARRADEWSRIADTVPHLSAVPRVVDDAADDDTRVTLTPDEWEVLGLIDGARDIRVIAGVMMRTAFDVAKAVHGLARSGLVAIQP